MTSGKQTEEYIIRHEAKGNEIDPVTNNVIQSDKTVQVDIKHAAASLDFSQLDPTNKKDLIGTGFYFTCFTCERHYSVKFTEGAGAKEVFSGDHYVYEIGIDQVNDGKSLVDRILNGLGAKDGIANPRGHHTKLCADPTNSEGLIVYDERSSEDTPPTAIQNMTNITGTPDWRLWYGVNASKISDPERGRFGRGVAYQPGTWSPPPEPDLSFQIGPSSEERMDIFLPKVSVGSLNIGGASVMTQKQANEAMEIYGGAIDYLDAERGRMGAYQNRLEHTLRSNEVSRENLTQAESRIRDTDMAEEMVDYTKNSILLQASQSMLAQANMLPEHVIKLLG